jgi:probable HAF family extracellular repeat protein
MHDLGTLPGGYSSQGRAINASGQVAGSAYDSDNHQRAFLYSGGPFQDLGALPDGYESAAFGINAAGQVVGQAYLYVSAYRAHAFRYNGSLPLQDLGSLVGPNGNSYANGINASGQVVGVSETSTYDHAFLYSGGSMQDLGTLGGGNSAAFGINDAGQVVGWSRISDSGPYHAFLYSGVVMQDLGTMGGTNSFAYGINAGGQMVGAAQISSGDLHAFLYTGGSMQDLNSLVKGLPPGVVLFEAKGINDGGWIAANDTNGHAYLLTPALAIAPGFLLLLGE